CHLSIKLTQLGLDIDYNFCYENTEEIIKKAAEHDIFINVDIEDYARYDQTLDIVEELAKTHKNVGTVFQSYLYRAEADMRSEEHTSELQSRFDLVCRLL